MSTAIVTFPDGTTITLEDEKHPDRYVPLLRQIELTPGLRQPGASDYPAERLARAIRGYGSRSFPLTINNEAAADSLARLAECERGATVGVEFPEDET
jgi:hypothetical protein